MNLNLSKTKFTMRLLSILVAGSLSAPLMGADAPAAKVNYQDHVLPILKNACLNCHNPDKKKGNLDLSSYTGMSAGGGSGKMIEPGDPDGSRLFKIVSWAEEPNMPPKGDKLAEKDLAIIRAWIAAGAPENSGSKVTVAKPKVDLSVVGASSTGKPTGPVAMPSAKSISTEPVAIARRRAPAVESIASSPWAPVIALGGPRQILLYHSDSLELLGVLPFPEGVPQVLKFSRNGSVLLAGGGIGGKAGKVVLFDVATGKRITELGDEYDAVIAADILPDQSHVALGTPLRTVKIYSTADGALQQTIKKHTDWVQAIAASPDGAKLASGDRAGGLWVFEATTARELFALNGHKEAVTDACFRGDSAVLASASSDGTIKLWNMEEGKMLRSITAHAGGVTSIAFTHDGRIVSCGRDNQVKVWGPDGVPLKTMEGPLADVALKCAFSHDGGRVVAGDWSGAVRVWNVADGKRIGELSTNPLPRAQRILELEKSLPQLKSQAEQATAAVTAAQKAVTAADAELAAANKALAEAKKPTTALKAAVTSAEKKAKSARDELAQAQAKAAAMSAGYANAQSQLQRLRSAP